MDQLVQYYLKQSLAPSTLRSYSAAKKRYVQFCQSLNIVPIPVSESTLCQYVACLANSNLKHQTIKCYLSGVRHLQIMGGFSDPFEQSMPLLEYVLRGIKSDQAKKGMTAVRTRLPITPSIMQQLRLVWERDPGNCDHIMLWAACCTCFFGFLRSGEITVPSAGEYDPGAHLSYGDVMLDSRESPTMAQVNIKASKTDPFRKGVSIYIGRTNNGLCPVAALAAYFAARGSGPGPFFRFSNGSPLTRDIFVVKVRDALQVAGVENPSQYAGHSFRIGAATTAAAAGVEDSIIKTLGRWESAAYLLYLRIPRERLAALSKLLSMS